MLIKMSKKFSGASKRKKNKAPQYNRELILDLSKPNDYATEPHLGRSEINNGWQERRQGDEGGLRPLSALPLSSGTNPTA